MLFYYKNSYKLKHFLCYLMSYTKFFKDLLSKEEKSFVGSQAEIAREKHKRKLNLGFENIEKILEAIALKEWKKKAEKGVENFLQTTPYNTGDIPIVAPPPPMKDEEIVLPQIFIRVLVVEEEKKVGDKVVGHNSPQYLVKETVVYPGKDGVVQTKTYSLDRLARKIDLFYSNRA